MTLSRFLRDYLYIPLGGNRHGPLRRHANLMATMLLGGLWHGAGWNFVIWGGLHGMYLVCNHAWQGFRVKVLGHDLERHTARGRVAGAALTFLAVVLAWVFFRAPSFPAAVNILQGMAGMHRAVLPEQWQAVLATGAAATVGGMSFGYLEAFGGTRQIVWVAALLAIAWGLPNSQQIIGWLKTRVVARAGAYAAQSRSWCMLGALSVLISFLAMINGSRGVSEFIYFNF